MSRRRMKHICLDRIRQGGGQRVLMIAELAVKLMESALAQFGIALDQKRAEGALREWPFTPGPIDQHTKFHVDIGELRKRVVVTAERDIAQRKKTLLRHGKHVRFHPA